VPQVGAEAKRRPRKDAERAKLNHADELNKNMKTPTPKACPICGSKPIEPQDEHGVGIFRTRCDNSECWLAQSGLMPTLEEWNRRAGDRKPVT